MSDTDQSKVMTGTPLGEISQAPPAFEMFLDRHQSKLIGLAVVLALGAVGYVIFKGVKQGGEETAGALLVESRDMADYQVVVKNHEGTAAARSAKVLLADLQWEDGQEDDAIATLREFLASGKNHPAIFVAKASLASKLRSQGKLDEAGGIYKELTTDANAEFLAPYAWICIGDMAAGKDDKDGAREAYEQIEKEFPKSPFVQSAKARLMLLKAEKPKEVVPEIKVPEVKFPEEESGGEGSSEGESGAPQSLLDVLDGGGGDGSLPEAPKEGDAKPEE